MYVLYSRKCNVNKSIIYLHNLYNWISLINKKKHTSIFNHTIIIRMTKKLLKTRINQPTFITKEHNYAKIQWSCEIMIVALKMSLLASKGTIQDSVIFLLFWYRLIEAEKWREISLNLYDKLTPQNNASIWNSILIQYECSLWGHTTWLKLCSC